jgi:hypothetical protein
MRSIRIACAALAAATVLAGCGGSEPHRPELADNRTWSAEGLHGRVRSVTIYDSDVIPEGTDVRLTPPVMISHVTYDTAGRATEVITAKEDSTLVSTRYGYDTSGRLITESEVVVVPQGSGYVQAPNAIPMKTTYTYRYDRDGLCIERRATTASLSGSSSWIEDRYSYDRDGSVTADSAVDEQGNLHYFTLYRSDGGGGWMLTNYAVSDRGEARPWSIYSFDKEWRPTRIASLAGGAGRSVENRIEDGRFIATRSVAPGDTTEAKYEYENDAQGNWIRSRLYERGSGRGERAWMLTSEERRTIVYW